MTTESAPIPESEWLNAALSGLNRIAESFGLPAPQVVSITNTLPQSNGGYLTITEKQGAHIIGIAADDENSRHLAEATFGYSASDASMDDVADSMRELANILVGIVKTQLSKRAGDLVAGLPWFLSGRLWISSSLAAIATVKIGALELLAVVIRQPDSIDHLEHRRMAAAIADREARLNAILEGTVDGIITVDRRGDIESMNASARRILQRSEQESMGQHVDQLLGAGAQERLRYLCETARSEEEAPRTIELNVNGPRSPFCIELAAAPFALRERPMMVGTFRDITVRKRLELELRQAQRLESVGRLAAGIAHEFNTPLQYVSDNLSFISDTLAQMRSILELHSEHKNAQVPRLDGTARLALYEQMLDEMDSNCLLEEIPAAIASSVEGLARIASIVRALKEFSRPSAGYFVPEDLRSLAETTIAISRNEWDYVSDLETNFDASLPSVPCIRDDLSHALLNVIVNAAHAIETVVASGAQSRGRISVSTHRHDEWAELRVTDSGCGISDDVRPYIFEPFFTTKPVGKGAGQGLAIAHNVIARHRGRIEVDSVPGGPTTFRMFIPLTASSDIPPSH